MWNGFERYEGCIKHTHTQQSVGSKTLNGDMHRNANDMYNIKVRVNIFDQHSNRPSSGHPEMCASPTPGRRECKGLMGKNQGHPTRTTPLAQSECRLWRVIPALGLGGSRRSIHLRRPAWESSPLTHGGHDLVSPFNISWVDRKS